MAGSIKGITIEIGGNTVGLQKALQDVNKRSKDLSSELKQVDRLLKFSPGNVEALAQKQQLLTEQVAATTDKLNKLKEAEKQVQQQFENGKISEEQYRAFRREIEFTQGSLDGLKNKLAGMKAEQDQMAASSKQLETLMKATGISGEKLADALGSKLSKALVEGTATSKQLEEALQKIGQEALGTNVDIDKMKKALSSVDDGASLKSVKKELGQLAKEAKTAEQSVSDLGVEVKNVAGALVAGGGLAGAIQTALDTSSLNTKIDISMEVPESSKTAVKEAIKGVEAYGIDAEAALEGVRRQWALNKDASDESNAAVIKGAATIASSYAGIDFTELIQETNEIGKELSISDEEALGFANSLLKMGFPPEQLDIMAEYGKQLKDAGFEAQEIQAIMAAGVETGTWNIDNLLDGLKEGRIKLAEFGQEVPKATQDLLKGTDISTKQLQVWGQAVAKGGEGGRKAMQEVATALLNVKDETQRNALGAQFFGTMWEDQGTNITDTLLNMDQHLVSAKQNQDNLNESTAKLDADPAVQMQKAFSDLKIALEPLLGIIASFVSKVAEWVSNNPALAATIAAVVTAIGILVGICMALAPIFSAIATIAGVLGVSIGAIAAPIAIAIAAIVAIIAIGVLLYKNWDTIKAKAGELKDKIAKKFEEIKTAVSEKIENAKKAAVEKFSSLKTDAVNKISELLTDARTKFDAIKTAITEKIEGAKKDAVEKFNNLKSDIVTKAGGMVTDIGSKLSNLKSTISKPFTDAWEAIKSIPGKIKTAFEQLVIKIPKPKLPNVDVSWKKYGGGLLPEVKIPNFSINWHKVGGVFTKPITMGNAGFGDVEEAIVPFEGPHAQRIASLIAQHIPQSNMPTTIEMPVYLDGRQIAYYVKDIQSTELQGRMLFNGVRG